jgi:hypothetical protein
MAEPGVIAAAPAPPTNARTAITAWTSRGARAGAGAGSSGKRGAARRRARRRAAAPAARAACSTALRGAPRAVPSAGVAAVGPNSIRSGARGAARARSGPLSAAQGEVALVARPFHGVFPRSARARRAAHVTRKRRMNRKSSSSWDQCKGRGHTHRRTCKRERDLPPDALPPVRGAGPALEPDRAIARYAQLTSSRGISCIRTSHQPNVLTISVTLRVALPPSSSRARMAISSCCHTFVHDTHKFVNGVGKILL